MVFQFLKQLKANVTEEEFKEILEATDQDIKFNRIGFGKKTNSRTYIKICTRCARLILRIGGKYGEYLSNK
ncbi:hypothetical protein [Clostridium taeniosporum]|uniref:Uncharacterized protein n=1 Tax=Clostridium taeniosporum TaxID=394958 RepID=A0A1D7XLX1_9CLOT|nr:hypothetical protein [Clostridium taeniosporum]AOR24326.1 hypothetical protein BGI42_11530 [Clostridium taeniosporum]